MELNQVAISSVLIDSTAYLKEGRPEMMIKRIKMMSQGNHQMLAEALMKSLEVNEKLLDLAVAHLYSNNLLK